MLHTFFSHLPAVSCATFSRHGGVSVGPYQSCNAGLHVGDNEENVHANRKRIKDQLGFACLVSAKQVHGDAVLVVNSIPGEDVEHPGYDALVTDQPGVGLMIQQADCQAVMLFDPVRNVVANIHSGWRGSVLNIIAQTVATMTSCFATRPADLHAAISPSLGPCCAEFRNHATELPKSFLAYEASPDHFDFWAISRDQLAAAGVKQENIEIAGICTKCDHDYFSFRREKVTGRFASVIGLTKK